MKILICFYLCLITLSLQADDEINQFSFTNFIGTVVSKSHVTFTIKDTTDPEKFSMSLQVKEFNAEELWTKENYDEEIKFSLSARKTIGLFFGLLDYEIHSHSFEEINSLTSLPTQILQGSYRPIFGDVMNFIEINIYENDKLYQLKFYAPDVNELDKELIDKILKELNKQLVK